MLLYWAHQAIFCTAFGMRMARVGRFWRKNNFEYEYPLESTHFYVKVAKTGENLFWGHYWAGER
jgi:hypothetical protein